MGFTMLHIATDLRDKQAVLALLRDIRVDVRDTSNKSHISTLQVSNRPTSYCGLPRVERISGLIRVAGLAWCNADALLFWEGAPPAFRKGALTLFWVRFQLLKQAKDAAMMSQLKDIERKGVLAIIKVPHELWERILCFMGRAF